MESYESKHSDHSFTGRLAAAVGVTRPPLRIDSQAKYGVAHTPLPQYGHRLHARVMCRSWEATGAEQRLARPAVRPFVLRARQVRWRAGMRR